ncbi:hypothetical protein ACTXT7_010551 [Hymenolepis weldensis]
MNEIKREITQKTRGKSRNLKIESLEHEVVDYVREEIPHNLISEIKFLTFFDAQLVSSALVYQIFLYQAITELSRPTRKKADLISHRNLEASSCDLLSLGSLEFEINVRKYTSSRTK